GTGVWTPNVEGMGIVSATAQGVTGSAAVHVITDLPVFVGTSYASYTTLQAFYDVHGQMVVKFADGAPVAGAQVRVNITNAAGQVTQDISGISDSRGQFAFTATTLSRLPGSYRVDASAVWKGNGGASSWAYTISG